MRGLSADQPLSPFAVAISWTRFPCSSQEVEIEAEILRICQHREPACYTSGPFRSSYTYCTPLVTTCGPFQSSYTYWTSRVVLFNLLTHNGHIEWSFSIFLHILYIWSGPFQSSYTYCTSGVVLFNLLAQIVHLELLLLGLCDLLCDLLTHTVHLSSSVRIPFSFATGQGLWTSRLLPLELYFTKIWKQYVLK